MRRLVLLVAPLLLLGVLLPASAGAAPGPSDGCQTAVRVEGHFRSVPKPDALLPGPLVAHAVEPADPRTVYLADPRGVAVSTDAGCTWRPVDLGPLPEQAEITSLTVPDTVRPTGRLLVVVGEAGGATGAVTETSTVLSRRGADEPFTRSTPPLPGRVRLAVSPSDPDVVYAGTPSSTDVSLAPRRSSDGGRTFLQPAGTRTYPDADGFPTIESPPRDVAVDPRDPDRLVVGSLSLQRSTDGGGSFDPAHKPEEDSHSHAVAAHRAGPAAGAVVWVETPSSNVPLREGSGRVWRLGPDGAPRALPLGGLEGVPQSLAAGHRADEVVLTTADLGPGVDDGYEGTGTLFLLDEPAGRWVDVMDGRGYPLLDARLDRSADPSVHLRSSSRSTPRGLDEYVVYSPPSRGRLVPPTVDDGAGSGSLPPRADFPAAPSACRDARVFDAPAPPGSTSRLAPARGTVALAADGRGRQDVVLDLAGDVLALDVFVVLDTSASLEPAAAGLACGLEELVRGLAAAGIDAHVGLATFADHYPGERYTRLVDVGPPGRDLQRALRTIRNGGGELEPHRSALYQAVTGEGLVLAGTRHVEAGQQATFRPGSARMLLHVTDEPVRESPGEPTLPAVVDALNGARAAHVALQLLHEVGSDLWTRGPGPGGQELLRVQLDQLSAATGAVAPDGGVDCDGDGRADLAGGAPLVCTRAFDGRVVPVAGPVLALAQALRPRGPVRLVPRAPVGVRVAVERSYDDVDLRRGGRFAFPVSASCTGATSVAEVALDAVAGGVVVASSRLVVPCRGPAQAVVPAAAAPAAVPPAPQAPSQPGLAAAPPGGPPPAVSLPAPAPAPAPAAAGAAAGAQGGAGAAGSAGSASSSLAGAAQTSGAAGLAAAPDGAASRRSLATVDGERLLSAVPLAGGALATAALTAQLLAARRRPPSATVVRRR